MPDLQYVHLNVFAKQPFTGNQLAVFLDAEGIDEKRMQRIALSSRAEGLEEVQVGGETVLVGEGTIRAQPAACLQIQST